MLDDRFWTKVNKTHPSGCWVWTANRNNKGYGMFRPGGLAPKRLAHRLAFEDANGPIPKGAYILHSCDNPACVNPEHLRVGTPKENVADMDGRGRRVSNSPKGEQHPHSHVNEQQVRALRQDYIDGVPLDTICMTYGVKPNALSDYTTGRNWQHILSDGELADLAASAQKRRRNNARLNRSDILDIRKRIRAGEQQKDIASDYGVHKATINDIHMRKTWRNV